MKTGMFSDGDLKKLIAPLVVEQVLSMLVGMVDTVMVSYAGEAAISGVALVDMVNYFFITVFTALATGGAVIVSQYLGNRDKENAQLAAGQLYTVSVLASTAIGTVCLVFHTGILQLLYGSVEPLVMAASVTYFVITALSYPFLGAYNAAAALYRSMKKTNVTMYVSLIMNVVNVIGNAIGIFVLKAGVAGVAVPTLVARIVAAVLMTALALDARNAVSIRIRQVFAWHGDMIRRILRIGIPGGIENGLFSLGKVLVVSIISLFGTTQIAANGIANSIDMISIIVVNAMNIAIVTVVGQCVGAREYDQAAYYTGKLMKTSYVTTTVLGILVCLCLPAIRLFYDVSDETWHLTCILVVMHNAFAAALHPTSFNLSNTLRAAGDVKYTMYAGIGSMLVFRLGSAVLFAIWLQLGVIGVWMAMGMDWLARSVAFYARYRSGKWKQFRAI